MKLNEIKFDELNIKEIGSWPLPLRIVVIALVAIVSILLVYFLLLQHEVQVMGLEKQEEQTKRQEFKQKYNLAANISEYEKQIADVNDYYKKILDELPADSQMAELIDSISALARQNNLKYESIKLGEPKSVSGFYKEITIDIVVNGRYHDFGRFISDVAKLKRIVTLHDFSIKTMGVDKNGAAVGTLAMNIQAKTYWLSIENDDKNTAKTNTDFAAVAPTPPGTNTQATPINPAIKGEM